MKRPVALATEATKPAHPTATAKSRALAVQVFARRIQRALEHSRSKTDLYFFRGLAFDPLAEPGAIEAMAERFTAHVESIVAAYNVPRRRRGAVVERLAEHWRFITCDDAFVRKPDWTESTHESMRERAKAAWSEEAPQIIACAEHWAEKDGSIPSRMRWPSNVSLDDIRAVVARSSDPNAQAIARSLREGQWFMARSGDVDPGCGFPLRPGTPHPIKGTTQTHELWEALGSNFHPSRASLIAWAEKSITEEQRAARFFALPASKEARAPFEVMARGKSYADKECEREKDQGEAVIRVVWDGRPRPEQLSLAFAMRGEVQEHVFRAILRELKGEGLRDYVILHRLAAEHKRTGRFFWTWEAHKRATAHEQRVRASTKRDNEARDETIARIWRLSRADLRVLVELHGRRIWKRIGEAPLVNVTGGVEYGGRIEGLELVLNPALYEGATPEYLSGKDPYFTLLPEAVLRLPSLPFCLAVMLAFEFRSARDKGGVVTLSEEKLHSYLEAASWRDHHRADASRALRNALDAIARAWGDGCRCEPVEGGAYRITPPRAWVDAVVHDVPPELPPTRAKTPKNGRELIVWREACDLSQRDAARALGVGFRTLQRAEARTTEPLPRAFREVDWSVREPAPPTAGRELPAPSND